MHRPGLGPEEDTGVVVTNGRDAEVIGSGVVTVVDGQGCSFTNIHLVRPGEPLAIHDLRMHVLRRRAVRAAGAV